VVGATLSRYRLIERLGAGATGEVYRAEDLRLRRPVALKVVPRRTPGDGSADRLLAEARAASAISHPNLAVIYEVDEGDLNGAPVGFIVMELVQGRPLSDPALAAGLTLDAVLEVMQQAAEALADAHAAGIVHRDIKPSNLMLTDGGQVKVLDFGLARRTPALRGGDETTRTGEGKEEAGLLAGTLAYMAPEQARGQRLDGRADMFSLGVVLYELLSGRRPFDAEHPVALLESLLRDEPPALVPRFQDVRLPALERIVRRMLAKRPEDRYLSLGEVAAALSAARGGMDSPAAAPDAGVTSVAVAGFDNLTANPDVDWLGTGLAETITADVSQLEGVSVLPHTRVHAQLRTLADRSGAHGEALAVAAARELGAAFVVTGAFQRSGGDVRVTATTTEVATGAARTIKVDGTLDGIFALQDTLVREIATLLRSHVTAPRGAKETDVVEAYEAFSKGVANLRMESFEALDRAVLLFERAVALDPRYARAHLELGSALATKADYMAMPELRERALASLRRGLDLQPDSVKGWRERGATLVGMGRDADGVAAIRRALALDPEDASALSAMGRALFVGQARFAEAAGYFDRALARNPNAGWYALQLAHCAALLREFERGEEAARRALALQEALLSGQEGVLVVGGAMRLGHLRALQGRHEEAVEHFLAEIALLSRVEHALRSRILVELNVRLGASYRQLDQRRKAEAAFDVGIEGFDRRVRLGADEPFTRYYAAAAHALKGDADTAIAFLERAATQRRAFTVARARLEPEFDTLRDDPRFVRLVS
jgi:tetratricopeptide (TPR) repeat protein